MPFLIGRFLVRALGGFRRLSTKEVPMIQNDLDRLSHLRNIGISAHIDSGKTTLTERILFYTGRIGQMHEVKGRDGVGATMDSMELEREKGITIQSAATRCQWLSSTSGDITGKRAFNINIIDTPGHVDFTVEVERSLRVLDAAILVVCAVAGVQSQTITVDRQMRRYGVPRLIFVNKLDRMGADPAHVIERIRGKLKLNAVPVQMPLGLEDAHRGVIDLIDESAILFEGSNGECVKRTEIPADFLLQVKQARSRMIEALADVDEELGERFVMEGPIDSQLIRDAIRRCTINRTFVPVLMGSAYHNIGVQPLLDAVIDWLPAPHELSNQAIDLESGEKFALGKNSSDPLVALAFKLEDGRYGQLTYLRIYQGTIQRGSWLTNVRTGKRTRVPRVVRMHANQMEDVDCVGSGEICALFGVDCASGDTFTDGETNCSLSPIHIPHPVVSLAIKPKNSASSGSFMKAIHKFVKEDPTFVFSQDPETKESIISGMGELHLEIYVERMRREFGVECIVGKPQVAYRESILERAPFEYLHKKQTGGAGQFARVIGYIEPTEDFASQPGGIPAGKPNEFVTKVVGGTIPTCFIPAVQKGFAEAAHNGCIAGHPIIGVRYVLEDGQSHVVDSSELAFRIATHNSMRQAVPLAKPIILEPIMRAIVVVPAEFQGPVLAALTKRRAVIMDTESEADETVQLTVEVPLNSMFGWSNEVRSLTQGKGEFTMEYLDHRPVLPNEQTELVQKYQEQQQQKRQH